MNRVSILRPTLSMVVCSSPTPPLDLQPIHSSVTRGSFHLTFEEEAKGSCLYFNPNPTRFPIIKNIRARKWEILLPGNPETTKNPLYPYHKIRTSQKRNSKTKIIYTGWDLSKI